MFRSQVYMGDHLYGLKMLVNAELGHSLRRIETE